MAVKMRDPIPDVVANTSTSTSSSSSTLNNNNLSIGPDSSVVPPRPFMGRVVPEDPSFFGELSSPTDGMTPVELANNTPPQPMMSPQAKDKVRTPFYFFLVECADDARAEGETELQLGDLTAVAGEIWDQMSQEEKQPYVDRAREEKAIRRAARLAASEEAAANAAMTNTPPPPPPTTAPTAIPTPPASPNMFENGIEPQLTPPRSPHSRLEHQDDHSPQERRPLRRPNSNYVSQPVVPVQPAEIGRIRILTPITEESETEEEPFANTTIRVPPRMPHSRAIAAAPRGTLIEVPSQPPQTPNAETRRIFSQVLDELLEVNQDINSEDGEVAPVEDVVTPEEVTEVTPRQEENGNLVQAAMEASEDDLHAMANLLNAVAHLRSTQSGRELLDRGEFLNMALGRQRR